tara:strand:- start:1489 stop:1740 length:252 start_codon:yes stop_codon:yes gene_type:complete
MDYSLIKSHPEAAFKKANKVISSCTKQSHLKAARKYINLFFNTYCTNYSIKSGFRVYKPPTFIAEKYDTLLHNLSLKERQFDK